MDVENKRLLFMGATEMMKTSVETAKKLGIYTIVVDYKEDSPAKKIADKSYLISTSDIDGLEVICKEEKVDGVFFGYSETNQYFTLELTERMGLPFYSNREQIDALANKSNFKRVCRNHGISVVPDVEEEKVEDYLPVIVKPVDSFSGKGITVCNRVEDLMAAKKLAIEESKTKEYLIEKFMDFSKYDVIAVYYSIQDGVVALSSMVDRYMYTFENGRQLNTGLFYPSKYLSRYIEEVDENVKNMIKSLNIVNGTIFIEGCVDEKDFYFWESGFRLCGAQQNIFPKHINNVDIQELLIHHAVTDTMGEENKMYLEDPYFKGKKACNGVIFLKKGKIMGISDIDDILNIDGMVNFTQLKFVGDEVTENDIGTLNQSFARIHIVGDSVDTLLEIINEVFDKLTVYDENGNNMLIDTFSNFVQ